MANIAIMGYGTLGSGLAEVARVNREAIAERDAKREMDRAVRNKNYN